MKNCSAVKVKPHTGPIFTCIRLVFHFGSENGAHCVPPSIRLHGVISRKLDLFMVAEILRQGLLLAIMMDLAIPGISLKIIQSLSYWYSKTLCAPPTVTATYSPVLR
jgi:hypothetical protein